MGIMIIFYDRLFRDVPNFRDVREAATTVNYYTHPDKFQNSCLYWAVRPMACLQYLLYCRYR
jgi:hypothetical protein